MWTLQTMVDDGAPALTFRVGPGGLKTMGRAVRADFILDAPLVSRLHCRFTTLPSGELEIDDLDSTNGTFVNDQRVKRARLQAGDRVRVGRVELIVSEDGERPKEEVGSRR
jgi:pSer/pThr/pTyr-binding forkhead associated (FHA) protein